MKPIITVKEARKILGKDFENLSDEAIEKLISDLDFIAKYAIKGFHEQKHVNSPPCKSFYIRSI